MATETTNWGELREKFFKECTTYGYKNEISPSVNIAPHDLFEWFKKELASRTNPVKKKVSGESVPEFNEILSSMSQDSGNRVDMFFESPVLDGWISIDEELPMIGNDEEYPHASEMILLSDGEFVYYGQFENSLDFGRSFIDANGDDFADDGVEITHWMPLPNKPITKQGSNA